MEKDIVKREKGKTAVVCPRTSSRPRHLSPKIDKALSSRRTLVSFRGSRPPGSEELKARSVALTASTLQPERHRIERLSACMQYMRGSTNRRRYRYQPSTPRDETRGRTVTHLRHEALQLVAISAFVSPLSPLSPFSPPFWGLDGPKGEESSG